MSMSVALLGLVLIFTGLALAGMRGLLAVRCRGQDSRYACCCRNGRRLVSDEIESVHAASLSRHSFCLHRLGQCGTNHERVY
jgi:hypothetical protein